MASEIAVAIIGGVAGLISGTAGSLTAPWAQWGVEQKRLRRQRRVELITEWRSGIDALRAAEDAAAPRLPFPGGGQLVVTTDRSDPPETRDTEQNWYETLRPHLSADVQKSLKELRGKRVAHRTGRIPDLLRAEVARLERDWKLV
ncbi:hypothetical protein [Mycolicibacter kumamotonensis]|uniref:Uncharacterized protein n=1 Tax=Mycolicibacter kumamotonensis TaxID=354243 RepID=A0A7K3LHI1_9MYCO|nr:hypothetical protein [Mycolicibacter kumamotonensis]NDJ91827.1 hypothetical protein [Mycolicibacter kumamotonensis]